MSNKCNIWTKKNKIKWGRNWEIPQWVFKLDDMPSYAFCLLHLFYVISSQFFIPFASFASEASHCLISFLYALWHPYSHTVKLFLKIFVKPIMLGWAKIIILMYQDCSLWILKNILKVNCGKTNIRTAKILMNFLSPKSEVL